MFAVAAACFGTQAGAVAAGAPPQEAASDAAFVALVLGVLGVLIGFSLAIAAVGLVNSLSLSVLQRRREIGLLRALGLDRRQVRIMVLVESLQLTIAGGLVGLVLGIVYGWAAALTALSSDHHIGGYFLPTIPVALVVIVLAAAAVLAVVASLAPTRRATAVSPVTALAVD
jgi:putative ABC transport system permease protein